MRQRVWPQLNSIDLWPRGGSAFVVKDRARAGRRPESAPFPARIGIVDAL
jgi:hypothetical protein